MNARERKAFDKAYEDSLFKETSYITEDFLNWWQLVSKDRQELESRKFFFEKMSPQKINGVLCLGIYRSITSEDFSYVLDALYTHNHILYLKHQQLDLIKHSGGCDCMHGVPIILAYAGNNLHLADLYMERYPHYSKTGHRYAKLICNLILSIIKNDQEGKEKALKDADKFFSLKNPKYDVATVRFLCSLIHNNPKDMSQELAEATDLYSKNRSIHDYFNDLNKFVAIRLFGLLSIAFHHLDRATFSQIVLPDHMLWPKDLVAMNAKSNFEQGKDLLKFSGELDFVQRAIDTRSVN